MCLICDRIGMIRRGENPYFVRELETGYVVLGDHQQFYGYTLFLYKHHGDKTELFHLDIAERAKFLEEMTLVAQAVSRAFRAEKMNYELLGMGDAHLHWHLFPRRAGDIDHYGNGGKGPVWWYPMEKMYSDGNRPSAGELAEMKQKLQTELDRVSGPPKGTPAFWGEEEPRAIRALPLAAKGDLACERRRSEA